MILTEYDRKALRLAADLLEELAGRQGDQVCDDYDGFPADWTPEDRRRITALFWKVNGTPEDDDGLDLSQSSTVSYALAEVVRRFGAQGAESAA